MATELDRTANHVLDAEAYRAETTGFGTTKQGQALALKYRSQLAERIAEDRAQPDDREVWRAFIGNDEETLALRLLVAGISVAEDNAIGIDEDDGEKNLRDQALWIGSNFGQRRELGLKVGVWGFNMLQCLPVFDLDAGYVLRLTASADEFMDEVLVRAIKNNAFLSPLTFPPEDWTQVRKGGLPADHWAKVPLIREHHPTIEQAVRKAIGTGQMQRVLDAINSLQRVPYCINEPILEFILRDDAHRAERDKLAAAARAQQTVFDTDMLIAEDLAGAQRFWVPLNMDFRGRLYGIPQLNFQREDHIRALFLFANGEEIGEDGIRWLKGHVAAKANGNSWSTEEKPGDFDPEKRVAWADDDYNSAVIRKVGEAVLRGHDPATIAWALPKKDKDRYQFAAACAELVQALDKGPTFETRLPITFDGTCSGLQHMCGMTRAEEGRFVNLTPSEEERGDDFYQRVAFQTWKKEIYPSISHWGIHCVPLRFMMAPFDRGLVKRPAMSYFYGSRPGGFSKPEGYGRWRPYGMTKQIFD
jgi:hypothetical protein